MGKLIRACAVSIAVAVTIPAFSQSIPELSDVVSVRGKIISGKHKLFHQTVPVPKLQVLLIDAKGVTVGYDFTDTEGRYLFFNIPPGIYQLKIHDDLNILKVIIDKPLGELTEIPPIQFNDFK